MFTSLGDLVGTADDAVVDAFVATISPITAEAREDRGEFSIRWLHLLKGRLAISLVRNPALGRGFGARFERVPDGNGAFLTIHFGLRWLNIDWV